MISACNLSWELPMAHPGWPCPRSHIPAQGTRFWPYSCFRLWKGRERCSKVPVSGWCISVTAERDVLGLLAGRMGKKLIIIPESVPLEYQAHLAIAERVLEPKPWGGSSYTIFSVPCYEFQDNYSRAWNQARNPFKDGALCDCTGCTPTKLVLPWEWSALVLNFRTRWLP